MLTYAFRSFFLSRKVFIAIFAVAAVALVAIAPVVLSNDNLPAYQADTPWFVPVLWLIGMFFTLGWNCYWYLFRIALEVTFDGALLRWRTGFASGTVEVSEITRARTRLFMLIELSTENGGVLLFPAKGVRGFVEVIAQARPELRPIRLGIFVRNFERRVGRSHFSVHPPEAWP